MTKRESIQWNNIQSKTVRANHNKFMTGDLRKAITDRSHLRNKFSQNRTSENWHEYKRLRNK